MKAMGFLQSIAVALILAVTSLATTLGFFHVAQSPAMAVSSARSPTTSSSSQTPAIAPPSRVTTATTITSSSTTSTAQAPQPTQSTLPVQPTQSTNPTIPTSQNSSATLAASPLSGAAPLQVLFSVPVQHAQDSINFGDASRSEALAEDCANPGDLCTAFHTYYSPGAYTATLEDKAGVAHGAVTIIVTGNSRTQHTQPTSSVGFAASPTSGTAPLQVQFSMNNGVVASPIVDFGDDTSGPALSFAIGSSQKQDILEHTYTTAGTYVAKFEDSYPSAQYRLARGGRRVKT